MKTKFLILLILLFAIPAFAGDYAQSEAPKDFRGMAWGSTLEEHADLVAVPKAGFKNTYYRPSEDLHLGQAVIESVAYYFRNDRLFRVGVAFSGEDNYFLVRDKLIQTYGRGRQIGKRYGWMWPEFSIEVRFDHSKRQGAVYYTYEGKLS